MNATLEVVEKTETTKTTEVVKLDGMPSVPTPDLKSLPPAVNFAAMLTHSVINAETRAVAFENARQAKDYISSIERWIEEPKVAAFKLHKFFTGLQGQLTKTAEAVLKHSTQIVNNYDAEQTRLRIAEQERQRREQEAIARRQAEERAAEVRRLEEARKAELEAAALLGLDEVDVPAPAPVPVPAPVVPIMPATIAPIENPKDKANVPWSFECQDLAALIAEMSGHKRVCQALRFTLENATTVEQYRDAISIALNIQPDPLACEILTVNEGFARTKARELKSALSQRFAGLVGIQKQRLKM